VSVHSVAEFLERKENCGHHVEFRYFKRQGIRPVVVDKRGRTVAVLPLSWKALSL
jgi:hypothetical protein